MDASPEQFPSGDASRRANIEFSFAVPGVGFFFCASVAGFGMGPWSGECKWQPICADQLDHKGRKSHTGRQLATDMSPIGWTTHNGVKSSVRYSKDIKDIEITGVDAM